MMIDDGGISVIAICEIPLLSFINHIYLYYAGDIHHSNVSF